MVSSFYSSNEKKQRNYIKDRRIEEVNEANQQERVDDAIDKELGFEQKATKLSKLAKRVVDKIGNEIVTDLSSNSFKSKLNQLNMSPLEFLKGSIENGTLSQLFDKIKALPNNVLNKTQQLIRDDLNNPEIKSVINDEIAAVANKGTNTIMDTMLEAIGGSDGENDDEILDMVAKAEPKLISQFGHSVTTGQEKKKRGPKPGSKNKPRI